MYIIIIPGIRPIRIFTNFKRVKTNRQTKLMMSFMVIDLWQEIPCKFKDLNQFAFTESANNYVLCQQYQA